MNIPKNLPPELVKSLNKVANRQGAMGKLDTQAEIKAALQELKAVDSASISSNAQQSIGRLKSQLNKAFPKELKEKGILGWFKNFGRKVGGFIKDILNPSNYHLIKSNGTVGVRTPLFNLTVGRHTEISLVGRGLFINPEQAIIRLPVTTSWSVQTGWQKGQGFQASFLVGYRAPGLDLDAGAGLKISGKKGWITFLWDFILGHKGEKTLIAKDNPTPNINADC
jgi:hypothetical protein